MKFAVVLALSGSLIAASPQRHSQREYDVFTKQLCSDLWVKYGLRLASEGCENDLEQRGRKLILNYGFYIDGQFDRNQARQLITNVICDALKLLNQSDYATHYMSHYPCTEHNLWICIAPEGKDGSPVCDPYVCSVSAGRGKIHYRTRTPSHERGRADSYFELWEDALTILKIQEKPTDAAEKAETEPSLGNH